MAHIRCGDYGYDCSFTTDNTIENVVVDYWEHMKNEHGIEYAKGRIVEMIKKKKSEQ